MLDRLRSAFRRFRLPIAVGVLCVCLSFVGWSVLIADRDAELQRSVEASAADLREAVVERLEAQLHSLDGLGEMWSRFGRQPLEEWRADANLLIDRVAGLRSVAWIDLEERRQRVAVGEEDPALVRSFDFERIRELASAPHLEGPLVDGEGVLAYRIFLPVTPGERSDSVLVATLRPSELLDQLARARARGYAIETRWGDDVIHRRGEASDRSGLAWWSAVASVPLPFAVGEGDRWELVLRPTDTLVAARLRPTPHYLLAAAIALSFAWAGVVHMLGSSWRQSRFLEGSNRALEASRGELRELNRELEERVGVRTQALRDAIEELEAFNYSVSHDLRSPLGAVLNFSVILEEDYRDRPLDDEGRALLARIQGSAMRATRLLEDLLQLSRTGRASLEREDIDMNALAAEVYAQVRGAEGGDDEVEFEAGDLPRAPGDRALIGTVLANLLGNALKYSRGCEKRRIAVSGRIEADECVYEISDNGRGFDMKFADKLFGVFERLHADEGIEGTGVGLAIVSRIVKKHGGRVFAEGQLGEGACIGFTLPCSAAGLPDEMEGTA